MRVRCPECGTEIEVHGCVACYVCGFETCNRNGLEVVKREDDRGADNSP